MARRSDKPPAPRPDEIDESLVLVAEMLLAEHFFDPDREQAYKEQLVKRRTVGGASVMLEEDTMELSNGACDVRIAALRAWTRFRVELEHPDFAATVEGTWSFENAELTNTTVRRTGDSETIETAVEEMIEEVEDSELDDDEVASFLEGLDDDDEDAPLIGDDPTEPPTATALDRSRLKAIAKRVARKPDADMAAEDRAWLEETPQTLPVVADLLIGLAGAVKRDETMIGAYQVLLTLQLEFVRYRQDRGWDWADDMLDAFQERLIVLGRDAAIPREDWFQMCTALTEARVPLTDAFQTALADAGFKPEADDGPPEQMMRSLRGFMDELAKMVSSPFEVIHSLQNAGAMLPAMLRGFMATELALSPHPVLRDAVPLMLLDDDASVRRGTAAALEQIAHPDTMSPDTLRRAITLRNWIPAADRPPLDAAIRKARVGGVEIGAWPAPVSGLEFEASTIDGSGAQSVFAVGCPGKKGFFGGLLLRYGVGVVDTWADYDLSRGKINKLLREARMAASCIRVDKAFVDTMVQHAIGTAVERDTVPPALLLEMAECLGCAEWKDRRLDIKAEADRLFAALGPKERSPAGVDAGFARGLEWFTHDEVFGSWFEDGPVVQKVLGKLARTDRAGMLAMVLSDILPDKRADWTERFLMMTLLQAAGDARQQARARDLTLVAHALAGDGPLDAIPVMGVIALQTVRAMLLGGW